MAQITNYDHCLRFQVTDKRMSFISDDVAEVVADNRGNICIHIEFDSQWDGVGKTARFIYNNDWKDVPLNSDCECICPSEVVKKGRFSLGVYGDNLKATTPITISVLESILSSEGSELPDEPTPDVYTQIVTQYQITVEAADEAAQAAMEATAAANEAVNSIFEAKRRMEQDGFIEYIKEKNKGLGLTFWVGTSEEYKLATANGKIANCIYIVTDENDVEKAIKTLEGRVDVHEDEINLLQQQSFYYSHMNMPLLQSDNLYWGTSKYFELNYYSMLAIRVKYLMGGTVEADEMLTAYGKKYTDEGEENVLFHFTGAGFDVYLHYSYSTRELIFTNHSSYNGANPEDTISQLIITDIIGLFSEYGQVVTEVEETEGE